MINNTYKKLFFLFYILAFLAPSYNKCAQVTTIKELHILDTNCPRWPQRIISKRHGLGGILALSLAFLCEIKLLGIFNDWLYDNKPIAWTKAIPFACCSVGCFAGSVLMLTEFCEKLTSEKKTSPMTSGAGTEVYCSRIHIKKYKKDYRLKVCDPYKDRNMREVSIAGVIILESIASQYYERKLTELQKECPYLLSWLIPPQKFETVASFKYHGHELNLRRPVQESWFRKKLRTLVSPNFPQRSLSVQEKILTLSTVHTLQKRVYENKESKDIGTLNKLPNEILEIIFSMALDKTSSKINVTKKEFFIHLLPYIFVRDQMKYFITDFSNYKNDVQPPEDTVALVKKFY